MTEWRANPLWVRLDRDVHEEFGVQSLHLVSRGERRPIAGFLGPDEKESFSAALQAALVAARRGPDRTVPSDAEQESGGSGGCGGLSGR